MLVAPSLVHCTRLISQLTRFVKAKNPNTAVIDPSEGRPINGPLSRRPAVDSLHWRQNLIRLSEIVAHRTIANSLLLLLR